MEEIITNATEMAVEATAEQAVKTGGKFWKVGGATLGGLLLLYGAYKGGKYLHSKFASKKNTAGSVAAGQDFDNVKIAERDFLEDEDNEE